MQLAAACSFAWWVEMRLEQVLQCELKLTFSLCVVDQTEGGTDAGVRSHEDGVIQSVDGFGTELQTLVLNDLETLETLRSTPWRPGPRKLPTWQLPNVPRPG